jgi:hypothetical protein
MQFDRLRGSSKLLNRKCPIILLLILQVNFSGFHFILITFCDCPSQVFEFCSHFKIFITLSYIVPFIGAFPKLRKVLSCLTAFRPSVRPSARREYLGSQWKDFHEIRHLSFFQKLAKIIKVSTKLTKLVGTLYKKSMYVDGNILLNFSQNEKCFRHCTEKSKHFTFNNLFFRNRAAAR